MNILSNTDASILFVPHVYGGSPGNVEDDFEVSLRVMQIFSNKYNDRLHILTGNYSEAEIKWAIGKCDFFLGSRMHACIAAVSQNIPTVPIAYSKKFKGVFDSIGLGDMVVDGRYMDVESAVNKAVELYGSSRTSDFHIQEKVHMAKTQILDTFKNILY
jgi:colanic acid/amylovoran biosynthesis protein